MKIVNKSLSSLRPTVNSQSGHVTLLPQTSEDIWHLFNLITSSDRVSSTTVRKIKDESKTGSVRSTKVRVTLKLALTSPPHFSGDDPPTLRLSGINETENDRGIRLGAHHSLTIGVNTQVTIFKDEWDSVFLKRIQESCDVGKTADLAVLVLQPGIGNLSLVTNYMTILKTKVSTSIPKKRPLTKANSSGTYDKAMSRFFATLYKGVLEHVDFSIVKCLLIGGPGFISDDFKKFIIDKAQVDNEKLILDNKDKILSCRASSGYQHAISELLAEESVLVKVQNTKVAKDVFALNDFMRMLNTNPLRAYYGYSHVCFLNLNYSGCISKLLITDELFRHSDVVKRKRYIDLSNEVEANGGEVVVFSTMHVSGRELKMVSGIAVTLRFEVEDAKIDEVGEGEEEDSEEEIDWDTGGGGDENEDEDGEGGSSSSSIKRGKKVQPHPGYGDAMRSENMVFPSSFDNEFEDEEEIDYEEIDYDSEEEQLILKEKSALKARERENEDVEYMGF